MDENMNVNKNENTNGSENVNMNSNNNETSYSGEYSQAGGSYNAAPVTRVSYAFMPNSLLNFLVSFMPGAGQMYQGLMQRGVVLMFFFAVGIATSAFFANLNIWGIRSLFLAMSITCTIIVYLYSFFDSMRTCRLLRSGVQIDDALSNLNSKIELPQIDFKERGKTLAGAILVVIGGLGIVSFVLSNIVPYWIVDAYVRPAMEALIPAALFIVGVALLIKGKKQKSKSAD